MRHADFQTLFTRAGSHRMTMHTCAVNEAISLVSRLDRKASEKVFRGEWRKLENSVETTGSLSVRNNQAVSLRFLASWKTRRAPAGKNKIYV